MTFISPTTKVRALSKIIKKALTPRLGDGGSVREVLALHAQGPQFDL